MTIQERLRNYWGHRHFREGQQEAIEAVLEGRPVLVLFPTGGGKSICYQLPATMLDGLTVVISPLVSLMQDQVDELNRIGIHATFINSTLPGHEVEQRLINARNGMYRLLYLSPERLATPLWQQMAPDLKISLIAVDEAHCISQWGHDFRPEYSRIREWIDALGLDPLPRWIALTATATPEVKKDILENLKLKDPVVVSRGFQRPNLRWHVIRTEKKKELVLRAVRRAVRRGSGIVYAGTRLECERISRRLNRVGVPARPYHAGLESAERRDVQQGWLEGEFPVVVATSAFGMGIDKPDCRFVIHYDLPWSVEAYYQEAGRAGRDGKEAWPLLIYRETDYETARERVQRTWPDFATLEKLYDAVCDTLELALGSSQEQPEVLPLEETARRAGLSSPLVRTGLEVLSRLQVLELRKSSEPSIGIRFLANREILLEYIDRTRPAKAQFLDLLYRLYGQEAFARVHYLELPWLLEKFHIDRTTMIRSLGVLAEQDQLLEYHLHEKDPLVWMMEPRMARLPVAKDLVDGHRSRLLKKLELMRQYVLTERCREQYLRIYFGEEKPEPCGQCDRCTRQEKDALDGQFGKEDLQQIRELLQVPVTLRELKSRLGWKRNKLRRVMSWLIRENLIRRNGEGSDQYVWRDL